MADKVDCCCVWESHVEVKIKQQSRTDRHPPRAVCQVTEDEQSPVELPETELLEDIIRKLLPTPPPPPPEAAPIPSDQDLLIQRLMGAMPITAGGTGAIEIDRFGNHVGTARLIETVNQRTRTVGRAVRRPYSDSDDSDYDVLYAE